MRESFFHELAAAVDNAAPRERRAHNGAGLIRETRSYQWVGINDVDDATITVVAYAGACFEQHGGQATTRGLREGGVPTQTTIFGDDGLSLIVVPILGAESAIVIGTLEALSDRSNPFEPEDVAFLEECAAVIRPLYD